MPHFLPFEYTANIPTSELGNLDPSVLSSAIAHVSAAFTI